MGVAFLSLSGIFTILLWMESPLAYRLISSLLWRQDPPQPADALYVLGGDYLVRIPFAASLYKLGYAQFVILPREPEQFYNQEHFTDASIRILKEQGVAEENIEEYQWQSGVTSTASEMEALRNYLAGRPDLRSIIIVTSGYHSGRALYTARRRLPSGLSIQVAGVDGQTWNSGNWWLDPAAKAAVLEEFRKYLYYVPRYLFG
ncbi:YdcF family protein [Oscillatoria amoena NRMC-F 0135]|nr:YdcF family protein [Oscillatoria amoena NRMC-F 0135]